MQVTVDFDSPPVHVTDRGSLWVKAEDILRSKKGQELIFLLAQRCKECGKRLPHNAVWCPVCGGMEFEYDKEKKAP